MYRRIEADSLTHTLTHFESNQWDAMRSTLFSSMMIVVIDDAPYVCGNGKIIPAFACKLSAIIIAVESAHRVSSSPHIHTHET